MARRSIGGEKWHRPWRRESRLLERPRHSSLIATAAGEGRRAGLIPERSSGWRPDVCRSCRPVGLTGYLLCRPSPRPPYRACRPNICRYGSRGKPRAANDVAHINGRRRAGSLRRGRPHRSSHRRGGRDLHRGLRHWGGAVVRRRPALPSRAREHPLKQKHESIDRYHRCCRAVLNGSSDAGNGNGVVSTVVGHGQLRPDRHRRFRDHSRSRPSCRRRQPDLRHFETNP